MSDELQLIALSSDEPAQGKTTMARVLNEEKGYRSVSFATPIKEMTKGFLMGIGMTPCEAGEYIYGSQKEDKVEGYEFTGRGLQIAIGEAFRELDPEVWTKVAQRRIRKLHESGFHVVVDDMRRRNEYASLRGMGATMVHIHTDDVPVPQIEHRGTEGNITAEDADYTIRNTGKLTFFRGQVMAVEGLVRYGWSRD